jgi:hypothetical protein
MTSLTKPGTSMKMRRRGTSRPSVAVRPGGRRSDRSAWNARQARPPSRFSSQPPRAEVASTSRIVQPGPICRPTAMSTAISAIGTITSRR